MPQPVTDDERAIAHAQRLATKVQQQKRELATQREQIRELEAQVQWYRRLVASLGVDSSEKEVVTPTETDVAQSENSDSDATTADEAADTPRVTDRIRRWLS